MNKTFLFKGLIIFFIFALVSNCKYDKEKSVKIISDDWYSDSSIDSIDCCDSTFIKLNYSLIQAEFQKQIIDELTDNEFVEISYDTLRKISINHLEEKKFCFAIRGLKYERFPDDDFRIEYKDSNIFVIYGALGSRDGDYSQERVPILVTTDFIPHNIFTWCYMDE